MLHSRHEYCTLTRTSKQPYRPRKHHARARTHARTHTNACTLTQIAGFFGNVEPLEGVPVINVHLWFDKKLR
jgi:hypothetical protein